MEHRPGRPHPTERPHRPAHRGPAPPGRPACAHLPQQRRRPRLPAHGRPVEPHLQRSAARADAAQPVRPRRRLRLPRHPDQRRRADGRYAFRVPARTVRRRRVRRGGHLVVRPGHPHHRRRWPGADGSDAQPRLHRRGRATRPRARGHPDRGRRRRARPGAHRDPGGTLPEVAALTDEIVSDTTTAGAAALAIQAFLRSEAFTYSLSAPSASGSDAISAFLLEDRSGYCIHFTAAMITMARLQGIPPGWRSASRRVSSRATAPTR
ncbi:transglutaminase domain-containing protein [Tessaracoccus sp. HDW20]|nr:transglutaminase domain-containing protein [Tessaracoccus coleopterorum]